MRQRVINGFVQRWGELPHIVVRAPGRVNLIGEHTDTNDGLVLPMAIDRSLWLAGRRARDSTVRLESLDRPGSLVFELGRAQPVGNSWPSWGTYVWSVADQLSRAGSVTPGPGIEGLLASEIPVGAGLASSAALELAVARGLCAVWDQPFDARAMSLLCQRAEHDGVGVACGVMDQLVVGTASAGSALLIDCRSLECTDLELPRDLAVAVLDTGTRRDLASSAFNERREQCARAAAILGLSSLAELPPTAPVPSSLDPILRRRVRHVLTENLRVTAFVGALRSNDHRQLGRLLAESQHSLREDFDVVTPALEAMVAAAVGTPGCIGARMTGAGFGGCAVALIERAAVPGFAQAVGAGYANRTGIQPTIRLCRPAAGVSLDSQTGSP